LRQGGGILPRRCTDVTLRDEEQVLFDQSRWTLDELRQRTDDRDEVAHDRKRQCDLHADQERAGLVPAQRGDDGGNVHGCVFSCMSFRLVIPCTSTLSFRGRAERGDPYWLRCRRKPVARIRLPHFPREPPKRGLVCSSNGTAPRHLNSS